MRISDWSSDVCSSDLQQIDAWLGGSQAIVRCMPNTPALLGAGATGVCANARVSANAKAQVMALMAAVGTSVEIADEALMAVVTAVSGRGPDYVFLLDKACQTRSEERRVGNVFFITCISRFSPYFYTYIFYLFFFFF